MPAFPFVGPAYRTRSLNFDASRSMNLFPELSQSGTSKSVAALYGTPGLRLWCTLPTNAVRGLLRFSESVLIAVAGASVYSVNTAGDAVEVGTIDDLTTPVGMASNGIDVMIVTGSLGYVYRPATGAFSQITDPDFVGANVVQFFDGYFVMNKPGTGQFYITQLYGTSIDGLDFATAEGSPDLLVSLLVDHRELWLFGEVSTEIWFNSGNADFPFERNQGAFLEVGCAAKYSPAKMDNVVYWLGRDGSGQGIVYRAQGYQPQRVSDYGVEYAIGQMARIDDAIGFSYQQEGHHFYVLSFPSAKQTWVFDANTSMWHERGYWDATIATFDRHRANCVAAFASKVIVGDWQDGRLYVWDMDYYTDDGDTIRRVRSCPHLHADMKWQFFNSLQIDMETGVGLSGGVDEPTPILLDTFTAPDGTDPTSRDMDVHPAGAARWLSSWSARVGVIESDSYTRQDAEYDCGVSYDNPGGVSFTGAGTYCLLAYLTATDDINWVGPLLYSNTTSAQINLQRQIGVLRVYVQGNGGGASPSGVIELTPSTAAYVGQQIKCALFVNGTSYSVIINGAVVDSTTKTFTEGLSVDGIAIESNATVLTPPKPSIGQVAIYQGITLAQALALTS